MKVLLLLKSFNYPPKNGGDQAVFNAIGRMEPVVQFHLIGMDGSDEGRRSIEAFRRDYPSIPARQVRVENGCAYQKVSRFCQRVANFVNNRNGNREVVDMRMLVDYEARLDYYDDFYRFLNGYIKENEIDIVQGEFHFTLGFLKGISVPVKKVYVAHELQYVVEYQRLMQREHSDRDVYFYWQQRKQELNAMNACDAVITLSEEDAKKLQQHGMHAPVFPSFAQIAFSHTGESDFAGIRKHVVFVGPESHMPNRHGLHWFMEYVYPLVRLKTPEVVVNVIGKWSEETRTEWTARYEGIRFLGYVDDLASALSKSVLVVPLFQGSGIRMKILEACYAGIPFVSTSIGAEGLGFISGTNCFITDEADAFAEDVQVLLENPSLACSFVEESKAHIHHYFSNERFVATRMKCYQTLMKG